MGRGSYTFGYHNLELILQLPPEERGVVGLAGVEIFWDKVLKLQITVQVFGEFVAQKCSGKMSP